MSWPSASTADPQVKVVCVQILQKTSCMVSCRQFRRYVHTPDSDPDIVNGNMIPPRCLFIWMKADDGNCDGAGDYEGNCVER
jgi:hypothetical protein